MAESNHAGTTPIWARPEPAARQPRISRQQIAAAALAIADAEGFEAVSMRRIARLLGTGTMSLYRYIETKDELLALVSDALTGEALVSGELPPDWRDALALVARQTRRAYLARPWAIHFIQSAAAIGAAMTGPNWLRHVEQSLAALAGAPLEPREKLDLLAITDDYVFGHLLRAARISQAPGPDEDAPLREFPGGQLASGAFPQLTAIGEADLAAAGDPGQLDERFERGLGLLLDGIAARYR
jgi:AcrR family transcriptional regulator